jgi:hypothetical protein
MGRCLGCGKKLGFFEGYSSDGAEFCKECFPKRKEILRKKEKEERKGSKNNDDKKDSSTKLFCRYCGYKIDKDKIKEHEEKYCDQNPKATNPIKGGKREENKLKGLGGWLVLVQIGFWIGLILSFENLFYYDSSEKSWIFWFLFTFLLIYSLFLMYNHDRKFPFFAIITIWAPTPYLLFMIIPNLNYILEILGTDLFLSTISAIIWTWYFRVSKRVKITFVN